MAARTALHQVVLRISPPPRTLRESREIYRSLRKYGEIDMYRNLRHEISTLEAKEDAIVLFRTQAAAEDARSASPVSIPVPAAPPSPIPSAGDLSPTKPTPPPVEKFTVEVFETDYNHESRIIRQLVGNMQTPYAVNQESPPGISLSFHSRTYTGKPPDTKEYGQVLSTATGGGWYGWRAEMVKAGIPNPASIKPASDLEKFPREAGSQEQRPASSDNWSRSSEAAIPKKESSQPIPRGTVIINPTPLPLDPTLQQSLSFSQRKFQESRTRLEAKIRSEKWATDMKLELEKAPLSSPVDPLMSSKDATGGNSDTLVEVVMGSVGSESSTGSSLGPGSTIGSEEASSALAKLGEEGQRGGEEAAPASSPIDTFAELKGNSSSECKLEEAATTPSNPMDVLREPDSRDSSSRNEAKIDTVGVYPSERLVHTEATLTSQDVSPIVEAEPRTVGKGEATAEKSSSMVGEPKDDSKKSWWKW
ncbi:hypothetical protein ABW19_dt0207505 [Dactylella cylindrospora]|nr:hypothetical protein ABW19_dt0207505 [Dactylella cylindrospora]